MQQAKPSALFWVRAIYNVLMPVLLVIGVGPWVIKMLKRGGFGTGLLERVGIYNEPLDFEPSGVVYVHAVSVGEVLIALKLIAAWQAEYPEDQFVLAPTTATGHAVARDAAPTNVRVIYSPIDFPWVVEKMLNRFEPRQIVLIESEVWPNLLAMAAKRHIPITVGNARLSARSERRYQKVGCLVKPIFALFDKVGVPEEADKQRWQSIGVPAESLVVTGSIKFDQSGAASAQKRPEFQKMIDGFGPGRPVVMALSTHAGEEKLIAEAVQSLGSNALCVIVPRHAERRAEVKADLASLGYQVVLRSDFKVPASLGNACFVIDSTGEMRDWTALASVAVIGKSFLGKGGQNPTEAIAAGVPVITGPDMSNFEPLVSMLKKANGIVSVASADRLPAALEQILKGEHRSPTMLDDARNVLELHQGATQRTVHALRVPL